MNNLTLKDLQIIYQYYNQNRIVNKNDELISILRDLQDYEIELYSVESIEMLPNEVTDIINKLEEINLKNYQNKVLEEPSRLINFVKDIDRDLEYLTVLREINNKLIIDLSQYSDLITNKFIVNQIFNLFTKDVYTPIGKGRVTNIINNKMMLEDLIIDEGYKSEDIKYVQLDKWWGNKERYTLWTSDVCFTESKLDCILVARLATTKKKLHTISWRLEYFKEDWIIVATGTDNIYPGHAYLEKRNSIYKPGRYRLIGSSAVKGVYEYKQYLIEWDIETETDRLTYDI